MDNSKIELNKYLRKIKEYNAKITPQRIEILNIFLNHKNKHFSAEEIFKVLSSSKIGQATVYRTLELFCSIGILNKINFKKEETSRYDLLDLNDKHNHHHLVCNNCGEVVEIKDDFLDAIEINIENVYHFKVLNHELVFNGICEKCQRSDKK